MENKEKEKEAYDYYQEQRKELEKSIAEKKQSEQLVEQQKFRNFKEYMEEKDLKKKRNQSMDDFQAM